MSAIVRLAEPIALTSIFPYAWQLVKRFEIGNEEDASFYSGLLISAFSLAEAVMGMYWGGVSDRIGRKPVLLLGCVGTMISMVMVGLSSNIWFALAGRAVGGLLNGNIGVIQTMVAELVTKPEHERESPFPRPPESGRPPGKGANVAAIAYSIMPFVWSIGTILGPFIGGTFADPHDGFPNAFPETSIFARLPYLLPNLICAGLLLISIVLGYLLLEETHPDMQPRVLFPADTYVSDETPLLETSDAIKRPPLDFRAEAYGTFNKRRRASRASEAAEWVKQSEKPASPNIFSKQIMAVVLSLSLYTYHAMTYDSLIPIFFEDDRASPLSTAAVSSWGPMVSRGGLGLSLRAVGMIMAVNGAIALFIQAVVFPLAAEKLGVHRLFIIVCVLHPIAYLVVPALLYTPESLLYPAIYGCLTIRNICSILVYPLLLILLKEATPSISVLGKVNGMAASAGAACRMVAPPVAGYLYTVGSKVDCTALAWYTSALVAVLGAFQCFSIQRERAPGDPSGEEGAAVGPKHVAVQVEELLDSDDEV